MTRNANINTVTSPILALLVALFVLPTTVLAGQRERLNKGEIIIIQRDVKGSDLPESTVKAVINVVPAKVWAFLQDCNRYKKHFPRTKSSKELSRKGNVIICKVVVDMPWPMDDLWASTRAVHTVKNNTFKRCWTLIKGTYTKNTGCWIVAPFNKAATRSIVTYRMHVEPTISLPKWVQKRASKSTLPDLMEALRKAVGHKKKR